MEGREGASAGDRAPCLTSLRGGKYTRLIRYDFTTPNTDHLSTEFICTTCVCVYLYIYFENTAEFEIFFSGKCAWILQACISNFVLLA